MSGVGTAVTSVTVGAVLSMVKELTERLSLVLLALSVTVMMQLLWVPSTRASKVIELLPATAVVLSLLLQTL